MLTRDEYDHWRKTRAAKPAEAADTKLQFRTMLQDVVTAEHLTGDAPWDRFLSWVSGAVTATSAEQEHCRNKLLDPSVVNQEEIIRAKMAGVQLQAQIMTLEWIMKLPKQLKEGATEVRKQLQLLDEREKS